MLSIAMSGARGKMTLVNPSVRVKNTNSTQCNKQKSTSNQVHLLVARSCKSVGTVRLGNPRSQLKVHI